MDNSYICPYCGRNDFKRKEGLTQHIKRCKQNPNRVDVSDEVRRKISEATKRAMEDPEVRQKTSEAAKKRYEDPEARQKASETTKRIWEDPEFRQKRSEAQKIIQNRPEVKQKVGEAAKKRYEDPEFRRKMSENAKKCYEDPEVRLKISEATKRMWECPEYIQKLYNTKKKNNSFNTSKIEEQLKNYFDSNNIEYISQYKSDLYPFCCDFYFPDKDLYVEIQGTWTHGGKPYNETDPDCIKQLELWKSKNTKFYNSAIDTWTIRDVKKRETAKQNNLNWIEIFSCELNSCIKIILAYLEK